jgi:hypothetical protein
MKINLKVQAQPVKGKKSKREKEEEKVFVAIWGFNPREGKRKKTRKRSLTPLLIYSTGFLQHRRLEIESDVVALFASLARARARWRCIILIAAFSGSYGHESITFSFAFSL